MPIVVLTALAACRREPSHPEPAQTADTAPPAGISGALCPAERPFEGYGFDPAYRGPTSGNALRDRIAWLTTVLAQDPTAAAAIRADPELEALAATERADLAAAGSCAGDLACLRAALVWTAEQNEVATQRLVALFADPPDLLARHFDPSGVFAVDAEKPPAERISSAWAGNAADLTRAFDLYVGALDDSGRIEVVASAEPDGAWFEPLVQVVTAAMIRLGRDEASRYEPLLDPVDGPNAAAVARAATIDWDAWPFALIVVPGLGPEDLETALTPLGASRTDAAAARFQAGLAPFVVTSGGHVHPDQTPYSEAVEMKARLIEAWDLPEDTILLDPYARHTTTNVRNGARIGLHLGMPPDAPILFVTDPFQLAYVLTFLERRSEDELGYVPWRGIGKTGLEDLCFRADVDVLTLDPTDPLDP